MDFPLTDWQFWAVTAGALGAGWAVVRPFVRRRAAKGDAPCANCQCASSPPERGDGGGGRDRLVAIGKPR